MRVFIVTFLLAVITMGLWFGIAKGNSYAISPLLRALSFEHILFLVISIIFLIFVIVTVIFTLKPQFHKRNRKNNDL